MDRKEFMSKLGLGAAFVLTSGCFLACSKEPIATAVDLTIDLDLTENQGLWENGNYKVFDNIVVARTLDGEFVAATAICSHQRYQEITFQQEHWYCTRHGARFDLDGNGLNDNGEKGLTIYKTNLKDSYLKVTN